MFHAHSIAHLSYNKAVREQFPPKLSERMCERASERLFERLPRLLGTMCDPTEKVITVQLGAARCGSVGVSVVIRGVHVTEGCG